MRLTCPVPLLIALAMVSYRDSALGQSAATNRPHHLQYESAIRAFEAQDRTNPPPENAVLFIGSSSIRLWTNAPQQFPRHRIINRGFGGSYLADSVALADRIVVPYNPKLIVLYAGDNDIAGGREPKQVLSAFQEFYRIVQRNLPDTTIAYLAIKPSPSRVGFMQQNREANRLIGEFISKNPGLKFVDVFTPLLGADGNPRAELFRKDMLHLNPTGYAIWADVLSPILNTYDPQETK